MIQASNSMALIHSTTSPVPDALACARLAIGDIGVDWKQTGMSGRGGLPLPESTDTQASYRRFNTKINRNPQPT